MRKAWDGTKQCSLWLQHAESGSMQVQTCICCGSSTLSPGLTVPERMRPNASNAEASVLGNSLAMCTTRGPAGLQARMCAARSLSWRPVYSRSTCHHHCTREFFVTIHCKIKYNIILLRFIYKTINPPGCSWGGRTRVTHCQPFMPRAPVHDLTSSRTECETRNDKTSGACNAVQEQKCFAPSYAPWWRCRPWKAAGA